MIRSGTIQVFSKNRDRLLTSEIAQDLLAALLAEPKVKPLLSHEHFSIDGTLLNAWASMTSLPRLARDRAQPVALLLLPALSFAPGHGAQHAFLEREMIQHVVYLRLPRGQAEAAGDAQGAEGTEGLAGYPLRAGPEADHRVDGEAEAGRPDAAPAAATAKSITRDAQPSNQEPRPGNRPGFFLYPHGGRSDDATFRSRVCC